MNSIDRTLDHSSDKILVENYARNDFLGYGPPLEPSYGLIGSPDSQSNSLYPLPKTDAPLNWTHTHESSKPFFPNHLQRTLNIFLKSASPFNPDSSKFFPNRQNPNPTVQNPKTQSKKNFYINNSLTPKVHHPDLTRITSKTELAYGSNGLNNITEPLARQKVPLMAKLERLNFPRVNVSILHAAIEGMYDSNRSERLEVKGPVYRDQLGMRWRGYGGGQGDPGGGRSGGEFLGSARGVLGGREVDLGMLKSKITKSVSRDSS